MVKRKSTVDSTVDSIVDTVENTVDDNLPTTLYHDGPLEDINNQIALFRDYPNGRYTLVYRYNNTVIPLTVFYDGEKLYS